MPQSSTKCFTKPVCHPACAQTEGLLHSQYHHQSSSVGDEEEEEKKGRRAIFDLGSRVHIVDSLLALMCETNFRQLQINGAKLTVVET